MRHLPLLLLVAGCSAQNVSMGDPPGGPSGSDPAGAGGDAAGAAGDSTPGGDDSLPGGDYAGDVTAPAVISTSPADAATGVALNSGVSARFSEPLACSSVSVASVSVSISGGAAIGGAVSCNGENVGFLPSADLPAETTIVVVLAASIRDPAGNVLGTPYTFSFLTGLAPDLTAPTVLTTTPADLATDVALDAAITITFDEAVACTSVSAVTVTIEQGGADIAATITCNADQVMLNPNEALAPGALHTVTVTTGVTDLAGNPIAAAYTFELTTAPPAAPVITVWAGYRAVRVYFSDVGAQRYDLYVASEPGCPLADIATCADGARVNDVTTPHSLTGLENYRTHYLRIEAHFAGGATTVSAEVTARPSTYVIHFDTATTEVRTVALGPDGTAYIGGWFSKVGLYSGGGVVVDGLTAALDERFPLVQGGVGTAVPDGAGGWYVGGSFTAVAGEARTNLAHILADGSVDAGFAPVVDGAVRALALDGSTLYIGGSFTEVDASPRAGLAALTTGGTLTGWDPGANAGVHALAVTSGVIAAGGDFTMVGGAAHERLALVGANGVTLTADVDVTGGIQTSVQVIEVMGSIFYVGGSFTTIGSDTRSNLAAVDTSGVVVTTFAPVISGQVSDLDSDAGALYIVGSFTSVNGTNRFCGASLDAAGVMGLFNPQISNGCAAITIGATRIYLTGSLPGYTAAYDKLTRLRQSWSAPTDTTPSLIAAQGNAVYIGGGIRLVGGTARNNIVAIAPDGVIAPWNCGTNSIVSGLVIAGDTLWARGGFTTLCGYTANFRGAVSLSQRSPLGRDTERPNGVVHAAVTAPDGTIYIGGEFTQIRTQPRSRLAAFDADGDLLAWDPVANGTVRTLVLQDDIIYAGGAFTALGPSDATPRARLAAIDFSGTVTSWNPGADGEVTNMAAVGSTLWIAGTFTDVGGAPHTRLAAIATSGTVSALDPAPDDLVNALLGVGSTLYVAGEFDDIGGVTSPGLAALSPTGGVTVLSVGPYNIDMVGLLGTRLLFGGNFMTATQSRLGILEP